MNQFIKEQILDQCVLEQLLNRRTFEEKCSEFLIKQLESESSLLLLSFKRELEEHNSLKDVETIYDFIEEIKGIFKNCVEIFNKNYEKMKDEYVKDVLSGAINIFSNSLERFPNDSDNMIVVERIELISSAINEMKDLLKESIDYVIREISIIDMVEMNHEKAFQSIVKSVGEHSFSKAIDIHELSFKKLNQYDLRVEAKRYMSALSEAKESLSTLKSIKVDAFEDQITDQEELKLLKHVLRIIQEIYKKFEAKEKEMFVVINSIQLSKEKIKESFNRSINLSLSSVKSDISQEFVTYIDRYYDRKQQIVDKIYTSISDELNKACTFSMRDIIDNSKGIQLLSCQVIEVIKDGVEKLSMNSSENEIVKGIIEAIRLKYDTLKEKDLEYTINKKENWIMDEKRLIDFSNQTLSKIDECFDYMVEHSKESFTCIQENYRNLVNQMKESSLRCDLDYLKTDLLFEIITLEEIVNHSLPKLKMDSQKDLEEIVSLIEKLYEKLENIIKKAGLDVISPNIHDKFNGKEHEVIMVENSEGFSKGEIISIQTKGYRLKEIPILRAKIIAAK